MAKSANQMETVPAGDRVFQYLSDQISKGTWKPGDRIPSEKELCSIIGVSRISVRAGINRLAALGILESKRGCGTFVCTTTQSSLGSVGTILSIYDSDRISMFEFRKMLEVTSVGYAAMRATGEQIEKMQEIIQKTLRSDSIAESAKLDLEFHHLLAEATANPVILRTYEMVQNSFHFEQNIAFRGITGVEYHRKILTAIVVRDAELAKRYMNEHLDMTYCDLVNAQLKED
ncbi:FadR/GntR family transcriptional regulator [Dysosmobacter sp.]|jgi:GntR family transcriptional repressor for pyruvate dehydrogenase complex|uniref:FadR/GntR family transcriptional regulator n=1 Tax=Dysosmobacter sp. TaxID=2591382 RepID=UPI003D8B4598